MPIINNFLKSTSKNNILASYANNKIATSDKQKTLIANMCLFFAGRVNDIKDPELQELLTCRYFTPSDGLTESARGLFCRLIQQSGIIDYNSVIQLLLKGDINFSNEEIIKINNNIKALSNKNTEIMSKNHYSETINKFSFLSITDLNQLFVDLEKAKEINTSLTEELDELKNGVTSTVYKTNKEVDLVSLSKKDIVKLAQNKNITEEQFKNKTTQLTNKINGLTSKITQAKDNLAGLRNNNNNGELGSQINNVLSIASQLDNLKSRLDADLNTLKENREIYSTTKSYFDYQCDFTKLSLDQLNAEIQSFNLLYKNVNELYSDNQDINIHYDNISKKFNGELTERTKKLGEVLSSKLVSDYLDNLKNDDLKLIQKYQHSLTNNSVTFSISELNQLKLVSAKINSKLKDTNNLPVSKLLISVFKRVSRDVSHKLNQAKEYEGKLDRLATIGWNSSISIAENQKKLGDAVNEFNKIKKSSNDLQLDLTKDKADAIEQSIANFTTKISEIQAVKDEINKLSDCEDVKALKEKWGELYNKHQVLIDTTDELKQLKVKINQRIDFSEAEPDLFRITSNLNELAHLLNDTNTKSTNHQFKSIVSSIEKCINDLVKLNSYVKGLRNNRFKLIKDLLFLQGVDDLIELRLKLLNNLEQLPAKFETETYAPSFINVIKEVLNTAKLVFNDESNTLPVGFDMNAIGLYVEYHIESVTLTSTLVGSVKTLEEHNQKLRTTITQTIEKKQEQLTVMRQKIQEVRDQFGQDKNALVNLKKWLADFPFLESCFEFSEVLLNDINECDQLLQKLNFRLEYYKGVFAALDKLQMQEAEFIKEYKGKDKQKILEGIKSMVLAKLALLCGDTSLYPELVSEANKIADNYAQYLYAKIIEPSKNELDQLLTYDFNTFKNDQSKANNLKSAFIAESKELIELKNECEIIIKTLEDENKAINEFEGNSKLYTDKDYKANTARSNKILDAIRKLNILFTRFALIANDSQIINNLNEKIEQLEVNLNNNYTLGDLIQIYNYMIQQLNALKTKVTEVEKSISVTPAYIDRYSNIKGHEKQPLGIYTVSRESILRVKQQFIDKAVRNNVDIKKINESFAQINSGLNVLAKIITNPQGSLEEGDRQKLKELFKVFAFIANNNINSPEDVTDEMIAYHLKSKFGGSWWTTLPIINDIWSYLRNRNPDINNNDIKTVALLLNMFNTDDFLYKVNKFQGRYISKSSVNSLTESSQQQIKGNLSFFEQLEKMSWSKNNLPQDEKQNKAPQNDGHVWKMSGTNLYELIKTTPSHSSTNHNTGSNYQVQGSMIFNSRK